MTSLLDERPPSVIPAVIHAVSSAQDTPTQGHIVIAYAMESEAPRDATLQVAVADGAPAFSRDVSLSPTVEHGWLALHGHLLPNGPVELAVRLVAAGEVLAERRLTVQVRNEGTTARQVAESLKARNTPLVIDGLCDSTLYDYADPALTAWFDREPAVVEAHLADLAARGAATPEEIVALRHFAEEGYLILPSRIAPEHLDRLNAALDDAVARKVEGYEWGASQRLHNLHNDYPAIRDLWLHPQIMRMLSLIFGETAKPCQSLTYVFGSEQQYHQDTVHLTPFPPGRMCGVWTALEDIQPESGELAVFPKSHKLERFYMATVGATKVNESWDGFGKMVERWTQMIKQHDLKRHFHRPERGEVLIWHENLLHAGVVRRDRSKSRRSIVGHYFANGAIAYFDSSGMPGVLYEGDPDPSAPAG